MVIWTGFCLRSFFYLGRLPSDPAMPCTIAALFRGQCIRTPAKNVVNDKHTPRTIFDCFQTGIIFSREGFEKERSAVHERSWGLLSSDKRVQFIVCAPCPAIANEADAPQ